jgi:hypothetical protein
MSDECPRLYLSSLIAHRSSLIPHCSSLPLVMSRPHDPIGRLDIEWLAIKAGLKPANRVTVAPERAADLEARARREGLAVERGARMVEFPGRPPSLILYLSPNAALTRELATAEAPLLPPGSSRLSVDEAVPLHVRFGLLLGFPPCCVEEFGSRLRRGVTRRVGGGEAHEDFVAAEYAARASQSFLGRLNDLSPDRKVRIVTFYPCRYDCAAAAAYAAAVFAAAEAADRAAAQALRAALLGRMTIAVDGTRGTDAAQHGEILTVDFAEF